MNKRISVCMATYNGALYVREQLTSILGNLGDNDEVVVSDDNSTDDTVAIVTSLKDQRVRVLYNRTEDRGHIRNFENALKHAEGDYIFLSDQDDVWYPDRVGRMMGSLEKYDLVVCDCTVVDGDMKPLNDSFFGLLNSGSGLVKNFVKNTYLGCCMAFNRRILEKALPFPKDMVSHDTWIGLMGEIYGNCYFLPEQLHYFIRHGSNFSVTNGQDAMSDQISPYSFWQKLRMRWRLLKNILKRVLR